MPEMADVVADFFPKTARIAFADARPGVNVHGGCTKSQWM